MATIWLQQEDGGQCNDSCFRELEKGRASLLGKLLAGKHTFGSLWVPTAAEQEGKDLETRSMLRTHTAKRENDPLGKRVKRASPPRGFAPQLSEVIAGVLSPALPRLASCRPSGPATALSLCPPPDPSVSANSVLKHTYNSHRKNGPHFPTSCSSLLLRLVKTSTVSKPRHLPALATVPCVRVSVDACATAGTRRSGA